MYIFQFQFGEPIGAIEIKVEKKFTMWTIFQQITSVYNDWIHDIQKLTLDDFQHLNSIKFALVQLESIVYEKEQAKRSSIFQQFKKEKFSNVTIELQTLYNILLLQELDTFYMYEVPSEALQSLNNISQSMIDKNKPLYFAMSTNQLLCQKDNLLIYQSPYDTTNSEISKQMGEKDAFIFFSFYGVTFDLSISPDIMQIPDVDMLLKLTNGFTIIPQTKNDEVRNCLLHLVNLKPEDIKTKKDILQYTSYVHQIISHKLIEILKEEKTDIDFDKIDLFLHPEQLLQYQEVCQKYLQEHGQQLQEIKL